jgi:hypothetical protein
MWKELHVGRVSGSSAVQGMKEIWPFGVVLRGRASNHRMPHWLKTVVVSDTEKASR